MKDLRGTKTAENLLKAFAGEAQARTRYTFYSSVAKKEGYVQISNIFLETAENEKEHGKRFFKFLAGCYEGENLEIQADYPIGLGNTLQNLTYAAAGEHEEWTELYPTFAAVAEEEGFQDVAVCFREIAKVEVRHENRYLKLAENIKNKRVFSKDEVVFWKCDNCGFIYEGKEAPQVCPSCLHAQKYFEVWCENY